MHIWKYSGMGCAGTGRTCVWTGSTTATSSSCDSAYLAAPYSFPTFWYTVAAVGCAWLRSAGRGTMLKRSQLYAFYCVAGRGCHATAVLDLVLSCAGQRTATSKGVCGSWKLVKHLELQLVLLALKPVTWLQNCNDHKLPAV